MKHMKFCKIEQIPEEVSICILPTMKVEHIVSQLLTYKKIGVQVIKISGSIKKLQECPEILSQLSKEVSIFVSDPEKLPERVKRYIENA